MKITTQHSGRIEHKKGLQSIADAKATWQAVYKRACQHDGIPDDSKFTVFSDDNPFVQFVDVAYQEYCNRIREYQAGGYVGLRIG